MKCFACNRRLGKSHNVARVVGETTMVDVGPDCFANILETGLQGYQPPLGGPKLSAFDENGYLYWQARPYEDRRK